jgi:two-component system, LuxR family, response regulator FixJ
MTAQPNSICILDDDSSFRKSIVRLLESEGLKALGFEEADSFLSHARSYAVPVAVLDVFLQQTSGLEVQARLREMAPATKVILMTGEGTQMIREAALEGGALDFLEKPFTCEAFLSVVRQALRLYSYKQLPHTLQGERFNRIARAST